MQLRRRLLFTIGVLDTHSALDRGTIPILPSRAFHTPPLNINDQEMSAPNAVPTISASESTDMSHSLMTYQAMICQRRVYELSASSQNAWEVWSQKLQLVDAFGKYVEKVTASVNEDSSPLERLQKISGKKIYISLQLILRRPPYKQPHNVVPPWDDYNLLEAASNVLEQHMQPMPPELQLWVWKNWVQWHALAVILAELTIRPSGVQSDRAYSIATKSFQHYAKIVADSNSGMLWKPIARLMRRVQRTRENVHVDLTFSRAEEQERLHCSRPPTASLDRGLDQDAEVFDMSHWNSGHDFQPLSDHFNLGDVGHNDGGTPWLAWDDFLQDVFIPDI
jgi:hypothetical protein